jgi:large subunit ribosomal protein L24
MKIVKKDKVMVITGRDKGKKGEVLAVFPDDNLVVVEGINVAKRHTKPSQTNPKGGIIEVTKPIDASKVMIIDPTSGKPARVGYKLNAKGKKERIYKVSKFKNTKVIVKKCKKVMDKHSNGHQNMNWLSY